MFRDLAILRHMSSGRLPRGSVLVMVAMEEEALYLRPLLENAHDVEMRGVVESKATRGIMNGLEVSTHDIPPTSPKNARLAADLVPPARRRWTL